MVHGKSWMKELKSKAVTSGSWLEGYKGTFLKLVPVGLNDDVIMSHFMTEWKSDWIKVKYCRCVQNEPKWDHLPFSRFRNFLEISSFSLLRVRRPIIESFVPFTKFHKNSQSEDGLKICPRWFLWNFPSKFNFSNTILASVGLTRK